MRFSTPLISGRLVRRYKRFLAEVELDSGETVTAHCANPGAMLGLVAPGNRVFLSHAENPARKLKYSWEVLELETAHGLQFVGINTQHPNGIVAEAVGAGFFEEFAAYDKIRREVKYGVSSRVDILLQSDTAPPCYVEIKNVHLMRKSGLAEFPDSVTARGAKHLGELANMVAGGARAVMIYLIQMQAERFALAADLDPAYATAFHKARDAGVEAIAVCCQVSPHEIIVERRVAIVS